MRPANGLNKPASTANLTEPILATDAMNLIGEINNQEKNDF